MNLVDDYSLIIMVLIVDFRTEASRYPWVIGLSTWGGIDWLAIRGGGKGYMNLVLR